MKGEEFEQFLDAKMKLMEIKPEFKARNVNESFSGGEKKRNDILQMAVSSQNLPCLMRPYSAWTSMPFAW